MNNVNCDYIFEKQRLESFKSWEFSKSKTCNPEKMAEAGFYCIGSEAAACFVCGKELDGWEKEDDPWAEHKKHAPQCLFVKNWKKEDDYTVKEFNFLLETIQKNQQEKIHMNKIMKINQFADLKRSTIAKNLQL